MIEKARRHSNSLKKLGQALDVDFLLRGVIRPAELGFQAELSVVEASSERVLRTQSISIPESSLFPRGAAAIESVIDKLTYAALTAEVERKRSKSIYKIDVRDATFRAYVDWVRAGDRPSRRDYESVSRLLKVAASWKQDDALVLYVTALVNLCPCLASWSTELQERQEQREVGAVALAKFLRQYPENKTMLLAGSALFRRQGRYEESRLAAESVLRLEAENTEAMNSRTIALLRLGRVQEALEASDRQLQLFQTDGKVIALAAAVQYRAGNCAAAASLARKAMSSMSPHELTDPLVGSVALTLIVAEAKQGHASQAAVALRDFNANVANATTIANIRNWKHPDAGLGDYAPLYDALRLAGLKD